MVCTCLSGWSKVPARTRSRPCSGLSMRSSLPIPALAFLALALAGCEVQPVVSNIAPPPAVQAETPAAETTVAETTVAETGSETGGGAGVPEIVSEAEPETAIEETDAVADTAAEQDDAAAETADTGQADSTEPVPKQRPAIPAAARAEDTAAEAKWPAKRRPLQKIQTKWRRRPRTGKGRAAANRRPCDGGTAAATSTAAATAAAASTSAASTSAASTSAASTSAAATATAGAGAVVAGRKFGPHAAIKAGRGRLHPHRR
ncbi:MAG: hypothetical protein CM15mP115_14760 [Alphaproteobacteria bacterium]|nr:MAG: hypothetical protein CM15mP115_14760 [Alphaproteobacteria bacterium]